MIGAALSPFLMPLLLVSIPSSETIVLPADPKAIAVPAPPKSASIVAPFKDDEIVKSAQASEAAADPQRPVTTIPPASIPLNQPSALLAPKPEVAITTPPQVTPSQTPSESQDDAALSDLQDDLTVSAAPHDRPIDPLRGANELSFEATVAVDNAIFWPIAHVYQQAIPEPLRDGVRNALDNIAEPVSFINYVLQLKPLSALRTVGRFAVNSTIGVGGLFNMARHRPFNLPRNRNSFGNTLGYYGANPGVFFYVPIAGPTSIRDLIGGLLDGAFLPLAVGKPFNSQGYTIPVGLLNAIDRRIRNDERIRRVRASDDPYEASRRAYLRRRKTEIDALHAGVR